MVEEGRRKRKGGAGTHRISFFLLIGASALQTGQVQVVNPLLSHYMDSLGLGPNWAGIGVGCFSAAALLARPLSVKIASRKGAKLLACLSAAAMGAASLLYGVLGAWGIFPLRLLHGAAYALCTTVLMAMAGALLPPEKTGRGMSLFGVGQAVSIALAPGAGIWLRDRFGYGAAFFASAVMAGGAILLVLALRAPQRRQEKLVWRQAFQLPALGKALTAGTITLTASLETGFLLLYGESLGVTQLGWYFTVSAVTMLAVRSLGGRGNLVFSQRMAISLGVMAGGMGMLWMAKGWGGAGAFWLLLAASGVKSLGQGIAQPAVQAACLDTLKEKNLAAGVYYFGCDGGQALGPVLGGYLALALGYPWIWLFGAGLLAAEASVYLFLWKKKS